jgi:hypothetical protein
VQLGVLVKTIFKRNGRAPEDLPNCMHGHAAKPGPDSGSLTTESTNVSQMIKIRMLSNYLFIKMVLDLSDSEVEEQFENSTTKVTYLLKGEEIGVALKKGDRIVKRWQILSNPSFGRVETGLIYEDWKRDREIVS